MSALGQALEDYLRLRRALGFKLERHGRLLPSLVSHLESAGAATVTTAAGARLGDRRGRQARRVGDPAVDRPRLRPLPAEPRPGHRGAAGRPAATHPTPGQPLPVYRRPISPRLMNATATLRFPLTGPRPTRPSSACWRRPACGSERLITLDRDDLDREQRPCSCATPSSPTPALLPLHTSTTDALGAYAGLRDRAVPATRHAGVLRLHRRHPAGLPERLRDLPAPGANRRPASPARSAAARGSTTSGTAVAVDPDRLVSPRRRRRGPAAAAVDVSRARQPGLHVLVPLGGTGTARLGRRRGSSTHEGAGHEPARPDPRGLLHRTADRPAPGQPAHRRRLPRRLPAAAAASPRSRPAGRRPGCDLERPRRQAHRRLPGPPRDRARQRRPHPQRPPRRAALPVPLRRSPPSRARRPHRSASLPSRPSAPTAPSCSS